MGQLLSRPTVLGHPVNRPPFSAYIAGDRIIDDALAKLEAGGWFSPAHYSLIDDDSPETETFVSSLGDGKSSLSFFQTILKKLASRYFPSSPRIPEDSLIIVDGMGPLFGIEPAGSYLRAVASPLIRLNRFCRRFRITLILIHHAVKTKENDKYVKAQDRALGSMALQGFTSTQLCLLEPELSPDPSQEITMFEWRSHSSPREEFRFHRLPDGRFECLDTDSPFLAPVTATPTLPTSSLEVLSRIPSSSPIVASDLRLLFESISKPTFYRYLDRLAEAGLIVKRIESGILLVQRFENPDKN
jgi:hypothetical protein